MSVDMYLPAFPALAQDLLTDSGRVQQTLSAFLLGFAIAPIVWGPLSDRFGRKPILYAGLAIFVAASIGGALSTSIDVLIGFRFLQALGGSAAAALARAIVRDRYDREEAAKTLSLLFVVMAIAPMAAPILGGQVLVFFGWRAIFWALAGFGVICLLITVYPLRETLPPARRTHHRVGDMAKSYGALIRNKRYLGYAFCQGLSFAAMFAYIAGSPFVIIELFGVSPELYGFLFAAHFALIGSVVVMMLFVTMIGANATAGALSEFPNMAGTASAFLGMMQFALGAAAGALVGFFHDGTAMPLVIVMMVSGLLAIVMRVALLGRPTAPA